MVMMTLPPYRSPMRCPHCTHRIGIFSRGWQEQRKSEQRHCPNCKQPVEVGFHHRIFAGVAIVVAILVLMFLREMENMPAVLAIGVAALAGFNAGLFMSIGFGIPPDPDAEVVYRRMPTEQFVFYLILAAVSICIFAVGVALWLPAPWSALALLAVGALPIINRRLHIAQWRLDGMAAQIYGGFVMAAGLYLGYLYILRF